MPGIRIDKWLWAARFFKTRSQASNACDLGRIEFQGKAVKAARDVRVGEILRVKNAGGEFEIEVLALSDTRGSAAIAQTLYRETEASKEARRLLAEQRKLMPSVEAFWEEGRPTKRDRRQIDHLRGRR
jgi:ribosome-associated heat shock protein Hsp15